MGDDQKLKFENGSEIIILPFKNFVRGQRRFLNFYEDAFDLKLHWWQKLYIVFIVPIQYYFSKNKNR